MSRLIGFATYDRRGLSKSEDARGGRHHSSWLRIGLIVRLRGHVAPAVTSLTAVAAIALTL